LNGFVSTVEESGLSDQWSSDGRRSRSFHEHEVQGCD